MQRAYEIQLRKTRIAEPGEALASPRAVARYCRGLSRLDREHLVRLDLDTECKLIGRETVHIGTLDTVLLSPREVFRGALLSGACRIILVHNHPSGVPDASEEDLEAVGRLREVGRLLELEMADFLIIGEDGWYWSSVNGKDRAAADPSPQVSLEAYGAASR